MSSDPQLVPARLRPLVERLEPVPRIVPSPLPEPAFTWYLMGGCWSLAIALHTETGYPIEVYFGRDRPKHAYVVDGAMAIDARGRNPLRLVRAGAAKIDLVMNASGLVSVLEVAAPDIRELLDDTEMAECAQRAAKLIVESIG